MPLPQASLDKLHETHMPELSGSARVAYGDVARRALLTRQRTGSIR
jgi:hypothetical protein